METILVASAAATAAFVLFYSVELIHPNDPTDLGEDGFVVWCWGGRSMEEEVARILGPDYVFLDYTYLIKGCSLSTFHRDVTSGQQFWGTKYPTYTALRYAAPGPMLSVCRGSHRQYPFAWSRPETIHGKQNTCILFNADILHAGAPNTLGPHRFAIQYKICHREDVDRLAHLNGVHGSQTKGPATNPWQEWFYRRLSYLVAGSISNLCTPLMLSQARGGISRWIQDRIPFRFYNNIRE
jgi:hypothetical protein